MLPEETLYLLEDHILMVGPHAISDGVFVYTTSEAMQDMLRIKGSLCGDFFHIDDIAHAIKVLAMRQIDKQTRSPNNE